MSTSPPDCPPPGFSCAELFNTELTFCALINSDGAYAKIFGLILLFFATELVILLLLAYCRASRDVDRVHDQ